MHLGVILVRPMAEVQPERVHAREEKLFKHFRRPAGWPHCGDDFSPAIAAHCSFGRWAAPGNQNGSDVVDVGTGRPRVDEIADSVKKTIAIMCDKICMGIEA